MMVGPVTDYRALREAQGLTAQQLADTSGVSRTTLWKIETGRCVPHERTLRTLNRALGLQPPAESSLPDGSRVIELSNGATTIVDQEDFERFGHLNWGCDDKGYAVRHARQPDGSDQRFLLHREIMQAGSGTHVHHANENRLDNRRRNLKIMAPGEHSALHESAREPRNGGYKGVRFSKDGKRRRRWVASITVGGQYRFLGRFRTAEEAAAAYNAAAVAAHGPGCYLNPVPPIQRTLDFAGAELDVQGILPPEPGVEISAGAAGDRKNPESGANPAKARA
jgi:transcriptional regulator with XRE-family HTH domain